jgi:hypothetical protein
VEKEIKLRQKVRNKMGKRAVKIEVQENTTHE